jgi:type 1 glutamine amidotransferase
MYYERTFMPSEKVHITVPFAVGVGVGNSYYDWKELDANGVSSLPYKEEQYYLYIEPAVKIGVKLTDKFRLNAGVTYDLAPMEFSYRGVTNKNVSGPRFQLGIRYGKWWAAK